jgi:hypothetical protein
MIDIPIERLPRLPNGELNVDQVLREYEWRRNQWVTPAEFLTAVLEREYYAALWLND